MVHKLPHILLFWGVLGFCAATTTSCSKKAKKPESGDSARERALPKIEVSATRHLLFTFRDRGEFRTVSSIDKVPPAVRGWVRVQDPSVTVRSSTMVYVADLRRPDKKGHYPYRVLSRAVFSRGHASPAAGGRTPRSGALAAKVILYSRNGCGACDSARAYLSQRKVPFVEKNIVNDPSAAQELVAKAKKAGVRTGVVPIIDVYGQLIVGFDQRRLEQLLRRQI